MYLSCLFFNNKKVEVNIFCDLIVRVYLKGEDSCWIFVGGFILIGGELPLFNTQLLTSNRNKIMYRLVIFTHA